MCVQGREGQAAGGRGSSGEASALAADVSVLKRKSWRWKPGGLGSILEQERGGFFFFLANSLFGPKAGRNGEDFRATWVSSFH